MRSFLASIVLLLAACVMAQEPQRLTPLNPGVKVVMPENADADLAGYTLYVWGVDDTNKVESATILKKIVTDWNQQPTYSVSGILEGLKLTNSWVMVSAKAYNKAGLESVDFSPPIFFNPRRPAKVTLELINHWVVPIEIPQP